MIKNHLIVLGIAVFVLPCRLSIAEAPPDGMDIFAKIMQSRLQLERGHISIETRYSDTTVKSLQKNWDIWFDGAKIRSEVTLDGISDALCLDCYDKMTRLHYTTRKPPEPDGKMALAFYDGYEMPSVIFYIPDPRWFGGLSLTIEAGQYQFPAEMYGSKREKYAVSPIAVSDSVQNIDCWRIDYKLPKGPTQAVWVDKSDVSRVLRAESCFTVEEAGQTVEFVDGVDSETEKYQDKTWFPNKLTYRRTEDGKETMSAIANITLHSLNEPLPADTFSPKGIRFLKPNTPVEWNLDRDRPVAKGQLIWDGNEVVALDEFRQMMRESTRFSSFRVFIILLGIAFICLGIGLKLHKRFSA